VLLRRSAPQRLFLEGTGGGGLAFAFDVMAVSKPSGWERRKGEGRDEGARQAAASVPWVVYTILTLLGERRREK